MEVKGRDLGSKPASLLLFPFPQSGKSREEPWELNLGYPKAKKPEFQKEVGSLAHH